MKKHQQTILFYFFHPYCFTMALSLLFLTAFAAPFGTLAAPAAPLAAVEQSFRVIYSNQKATANVVAKATLKVMKTDLSGLLGEASSNVIAGGNFESMPLSFNVDHQGAGNITYGDSTYRVHVKPEISGGIACTRMYSPSSFLVDCIMPWRGNAPPTESLSIVRHNVDSLKADFGLEVLPVLPELATSGASTQALRLDDSVSSQQNASPEIMSEKAIPPGDCYGATQHVRNKDNGDGFPHQNYFHIQQSVSYFHTADSPTNC
jgi:hypothetical protein